MTGQMKCPYGCGCNEIAYSNRHGTVLKCGSSVVDGEPASRGDECLEKLYSQATAKLSKVQELAEDYAESSDTTICICGKQVIDVLEDE